jgi:hypothetical protein
MVDHRVESFTGVRVPWHAEVTVFDWDEAVSRQCQFSRPVEERRQSPRANKGRRRAERLAIDSDAQLYVSATRSLKGHLLDLSTDGCCLVVEVNPFTPGVRLSLKIGDMERWPGTVRWIAMHRIGIQFDQPLHPAIVEHLVRSKNGGNLGS